MKHVFTYLSILLLLATNVFWFIQDKEHKAEKLKAEKGQLEELKLTGIRVSRELNAAFQSVTSWTIQRYKIGPNGSFLVLTNPVTTNSSSFAFTHGTNVPTDPSIKVIYP